MLARLILVLTCIAALPLAATAQFGPEQASPRTAKEIYADRAMKDAANLIRVTPTDIVTTKDGIDPERAQKWHNQARTRYQELCDARETRADFWSRNCYKLADIYRRGLGITQDYSLAKTFYMAACLEGQHLNACLQQAYIDHAGNAGEKDWPNARKLYEIACDMGDPSGCAGLGNMLYRAQGGPEDRKLGAILIQNACAAEYEWACERLEGFGLTRRARRF